MSKPVRITRDVWKKILGDQRTIKSIEQLFDAVPSNISSLTDNLSEVEIQAGNADTKAQSALDQLKISKILGQFYDTTPQSATAVNTGKAIVFNNTDISHGVKIDSGVTSRIIVNKTGLYKIEIRIQL